MEKELRKRISTACVGGFVLVALVVFGGLAGIFFDLPCNGSWDGF